MIGRLRTSRNPVDRMPSSTRKPLVCVALAWEPAPSETFIRAHLGMPQARVATLLEGVLTTPAGRRFGLRSSAPFVRAMNFLGRRVLGRNHGRIHSQLLARRLRRAGVDIVLAEFGPTAVSVWRSCGLARVPLVAHFHGYDAYEERVLATYGEGYRELFRHCAAVVAVSQDMARQLEHLGAPAERIVVNPCGVDTSFFSGAQPEQAPPLFAAVGRFVDKKAPHLTILAFEKVLHDTPNARLSMAGDGPLLESSRQLVGALGMGSAVDLMGTRSPAEVVRVLRGARAFVQHSLTTTGGDSEGTPVSILEAGAVGLPVVSTRHGGISDVVLDGETGFLVEERDMTGMGEAMGRLARLPAVAGRMGRANRERIVKNYSLDRSLSKLWEVLNRAMSGRTRGS